MALKNVQYDEIMRSYNRRQMEHKHALDLRIQTAYQTLPALHELDAQEADASVACAARMFSGDAGADQELSDTIAQIEANRKSLLASAGFPADYLQMTYSCPLCKDTGFDEQGKKCSCFQKAAIDLLYAETGQREQYKKENFQTFCLDYYPENVIDSNTGLSARALAKQALDAALLYVEQFPANHGSLLIYGPTGVGKTFLSNCIGKELLENIYSVMQLPAADFFEQLAAHQFRTDEDEALYESITACDLLIIDDLGTEISNQFTTNSLCACIDSRLKNGQGTIITTNLELPDLQAKYLDRTFSRLISGYTFIRMAGNDIRYHKKQQRLAE